MGGGFLLLDRVTKSLGACYAPACLPSHLSLFPCPPLPTLGWEALFTYPPRMLPACPGSADPEGSIPCPLVLSFS